MFRLLDIRGLRPQHTVNAPVRSNDRVSAERLLAKPSSRHCSCCSVYGCRSNAHHGNPHQRSDVTDAHAILVIVLLLRFTLPACFVYQPAS